MADPRTVLLVIVLFLLILSPDPQPFTSITQRNELNERVEREQAHLTVMRNATFEEFDDQERLFLDLPGFRSQDGFSWIALPALKRKVRDMTSYALGESSLTVLDGETAVRANVYNNITGYARGHWLRSDLEKELQLYREAPLLGDQDEVQARSHGLQRNVTSPSGEVTVQFREKDAANLQVDNVRALTADFTIQDITAPGDGWEITMHGLHFVEHGGLLLTTTSSRFAGIFALPQFSLSSYQFERSRQLLNKTIADTIERQKAFDDTVFSPWASTNGFDLSTAQCEYVCWMQQLNIMQPALPAEQQQKHGQPTNPRNDFLALIEQNVRFPNGAPTPPIPSLTMSMLIFSPDCGFILESQGPPTHEVQDGNHLQGRKQEVQMARARRMVIMYAVLLCAQLVLSIRQINEASTPSTRSRISFYTIAALTMGDGMACLVFITLALFVPALWLVCCSAAYLSFLCVTFFGMRFLLDLWAVQEPERRRQEQQSQRERQTNVSTTAPTDTADPTNEGSAPAPAAVQPTQPPLADSGLPLPATAPRPPGSILTSDQDGTLEGLAEGGDTADGTNLATAGNNTPARQFSAVYSRFVFVLLVISFLSISATTWPRSARDVYCNLLAFLYLSFWVPQIFRNVMRNCRKALRWDYVVGQSVLRLIPFLYAYVVEDNVVFAHTDRIAAAGLVGWVWLQILFLLVQELLGPRLFVREGWAPPAYDYHPILRDDDEEGALPIGFTEATNTETDAVSPIVSKKEDEARTGPKRMFDCAICMQDIDVPILGRSNDGDGSTVAGTGPGSTQIGASLLARRAYMVTPCRHIFHTQCLEGWMKYRLQCPVCRESLPPL